MADHFDRLVHIFLSIFDETMILSSKMRDFEDAFIQVDKIENVDTLGERI